MKELEDKQSVSTKNADEYERKNVEINKILDQLRKGKNRSFIGFRLCLKNIGLPVPTGRFERRVTHRVGGNGKRSLQSTNMAQSR